MEIRNYINGEWLKPEANEYLDVINPATGSVIAKAPLGSKADVDHAAKAASAQSSSGCTRSAMMNNCRDLWEQPIMGYRIHHENLIRQTSAA